MYWDIFEELQAIPPGEARIVRDYPVERLGNDFRATHSDGQPTSWWAGTAMAYIIEQWLWIGRRRGVSTNQTL